MAIWDSTDGFLGEGRVMGALDQIDWDCAAFAADETSLAAVRQAIAVGQADIDAGRFLEFTDQATMARFLDELVAKVLA
jgi:hypothetical protein